MKRIFLLPLLLAVVVRAQDANYYVTRSDLSAYAPLSALDDYATTASLAGYALRSDLSAYAPLSALAGIPSAVTLTNYVLRSDLAAYATLAALAGYATTASLAGYALLSDLSAYVPASALDDYATVDALAAYATVANLAAATASASNSFLHAFPTTIRSNTYWHVPTRTVFDGSVDIDGNLIAVGTATFEDDVDFEDDVFFNGGALFDRNVTFGSVTRTRWTDLQSRAVTNSTLTATSDDCIIWSDPAGDECFVYLPAETNAPDHTRTVVVRDMAGADANTSVYVGTTNSATLLLTLTETNQTAVFDWCPPLQTWLPR